MLEQLPFNDTTGRSCLGALNHQGLGLPQMTAQALGRLVPSGKRLYKVLIAGILLLEVAAKPAQAFDWRANFIDPDDGYFDVSGFVGGGGFIPVPVIITEPAVKGGLGLMGQFVHTPTSPGTPPDRTVAGGAVTRNGSKGGGLLHQGSFGEGRFVYRVGFGLADVTLPIFPFGGRSEIDYENKAIFGFANIRYRVPDTPVSLGPRFIYRTSDVSLKAAGPLGDRVSGLLERFSGKNQYVALGFSLNFDTRNNAFTPTKGINAIFKYDFYTETLGSDAEFGSGQLAVHAFAELGDNWSLGGKLRFDTVTANAPFFMAPGVDLRGVQYGRYQGDMALSLEAELRRQLSSRWAAVAFGGYGATFVNKSRLYRAESGIWTYGAGVRYRIARKLGIDVGLDVARGPEDTVFYIQFGHAWAMTMD